MRYTGNEVPLLKFTFCIIARGRSETLLLRKVVQYLEDEYERGHL